MSKKDWMQKAEAEMEKKGTVGLFTKKAKAKGMTTVQFADEVLSNPDNYSEKTRKEAQFMKNANPELFENGGITGKYSLINMVDEKDGLVSGYWLQDHTGSYEDAIEKAKATEKANSDKITVVVTEQVATTNPLAHGKFEGLKKVMKEGGITKDYWADHSDIVQFTLGHGELAKMSENQIEDYSNKLIKAEMKRSNSSYEEALKTVYNKALKNADEKGIYKNGGSVDILMAETDAYSKRQFGEGINKDTFLVSGHKQGNKPIFDYVIAETTSGRPFEATPEQLFKLEKGGKIKEEYYIFEGLDHRNQIPLYRVSGRDNEYLGEWHMDKSVAQEELDRLLEKKKSQPKKKKTMSKKWYVTRKPSEEKYQLYDFARTAAQAKKMLKDLEEGNPIAQKSRTQGGNYNIYVEKGTALWMEKGGEIKESEKYASEYRIEKDGTISHRPIGATTEEWSTVDLDRAFNKKERKEFDSEMTRLFGEKYSNGGAVDEENPHRHTYMMLGRLQSDNDYFLGFGGANEKQLWAGNVNDQISEMKKLWNELPKDGKPEWLTMEEIEDYETKMKAAKSEKMAEGGVIEEYDDLPSHVKKAIDTGYNENNDPYREAEKMRERLAEIGWDMDYDLSGAPTRFWKKDVKAKGGSVKAKGCSCNSCPKCNSGWGINLNW
jgi:hypothetical protein